MEAVEKRRVIGGRKQPQVQYLFKWADEDKRTWETRNSFERWGDVDYERGMSREALETRFNELDEIDARQTQKKRKKKH